MAHASRLVAQGSWLMAKENLALENVNAKAPGCSGFILKVIIWNSATQACRTCDNVVPNLVQFSYWDVLFTQTLILWVLFLWGLLAATAAGRTGDARGHGAVLPV